MEGGDKLKPSSGMYQELDNNELFDSTLEEVGGFGRFQIRTLVLSLLVSILSACNHLSPIFLAFSPTKTCAYGDAPDKGGCMVKVGGKLEKCKEWNYTQDVFKETLVTDFNLVCDRSYLLPTIASSYMAGVSNPFTNLLFLGT